MKLKNSKSNKNLNIVDNPESSITKKTSKILKQKLDNSLSSEVSSLSKGYIETEVNKQNDSNNKSTSSSILMFNELNHPNQYNTEIQKPNIIIIQLKGKDKSLKIDFALAEKGYPGILSTLNYETKILCLEEEWMDLKTIKDYFKYVKQYYSTNKSDSHLKLNFKKLIKLANYFENEKILSFIIQKDIQPNINYDTCITLINDAFSYCSKSELKQNLKSKWFSLFLEIRNFIIGNFTCFLSLQNYTKLDNLNKLILEEVIESFLLDIYTKGIEIGTEEASIIVYLIMHYRDQDVSSIEQIDYNKIFILLSKENQYLDSSSIDKELSSLNEPTFNLNLLKDIQYNYQEKVITFHKQEVIFISKYDNASDTFTISLKLNPMSKTDVFSFYSYSFIREETETNQSTFATINTNSKITIFTINSFKEYLNYLKSIRELENIYLTINLKFCVMQSFLICYLKSLFDQVYSLNSIKYLPYDMFNSFIIENDASEDKILISLMTWLSNCNNDPDDVIEVLDLINWKNIPLGRIFEFVIKFPNCVQRCSTIESYIITSIFSKATNKLNELKKDKIYTPKQTNIITERNNTQYSYDANIDKCEAIIELHNKNNGDKNNNIEDNDSLFNNNIQSNDSQLHLISYFFVNLVECSKKLNYQKLAYEQEDKDISHIALNIQNEKKNNKFIRITNVSQCQNSQQSLSNVDNYFNISTNSNNNVDTVTEKGNVVNNKIETCENDLGKIPSIVLQSRRDENNQNVKSNSIMKEHKIHKRRNSEKSPNSDKRYRQIDNNIIKHSHRFSVKETHKRRNKSELKTDQ